MHPSISIIIITKNEAHDLPACLASVAWADEIIVLDSGSTDATQQIALQYTTHVYQSEDWQGFGIQKNRALGYASGDWVLSLDADERVSEALKLEIQQTIRFSDQLVFSMPRLSSYCGRYMGHSGWWPDRVARLFKRGHASFSNDLVHERLLFTGTAKHLKSPILHITYQNLEEVILKINSYSSLGAENAYKQGNSSSLFTAIVHGVWAFLRTYVIRSGFLDGTEGFMLAVSNAEVTYYRYLKLYYLINNKKLIENQQDSHSNPS